MLLLLCTAGQAVAKVKVDREWRFAGPFAAGKNERAVDVVQLPGHGGPPAELPDLHTFPSEFVRGGRAGWQNLQALDTGVVDLQPYVGGQAAFGWAVGRLTVRGNECVVLRVTGHVTLAWVNNISMPMHAAGLRTTLSTGTHTITLRVATSGGGLYFHVVANKCQPPRADIRIIKLLPGDWQVGHGKWESGPVHCLPAALPCVYKGCACS